MIHNRQISAIIASAGTLCGILAGAFFALSHDLPQINQLKHYRPPTVTSVYSADRKLIAQFYIEKRFPVSLESIPSHLKQALLTIEDRHFYSHSGLHFKAILRALIQDIKSGKFKQGASTITQQLAKTLFLTPRKTMVRKIKEAILAFQLERRYTKDEILDIMQSLRNKGATYAQIADHLTQEGIPTFSGKGKWHAQTIHRLCK